MTRPARFVLGTAVGIAALWTIPVAAHPVPFSYLDLRLAPDRIDATLVLHIFDVGHDLQIDPADRLLDRAAADARARDVAALATRHLHLAVDGHPWPADWTGPEILTERRSLRLHAVIALTASAGTITVDGTMFPYDPAHQTFINVYEGAALTQAIIDRDHHRFEYFAGTRQGVVAVVKKFILAGVRHILIGPDHVLFLVGLLLLGGSLRRLALIVTGFTLAHSLTLSLAALNIVTPPLRMVEPAIALSIVFVGADNLLKREGRDVRVWIAFGFGFIHGFGFANVLREMDLPARALGWSLGSFNIGVEIGQLLVVATVGTALAIVRARSPVLARRLVVVGSLGIVVAGAVWFVERLTSAGGFG